MLRSLHIALVFMTTLPLPPVKHWHAQDGRRSVQTYPLVGLIIGLILLLSSLLSQAFPAMIGAAIVLACWFGITGLLHFDGFCDTADAVFASKSALERQSIAKDVHLGSFALAAGSLLILFKLAGLHSLTNPGWLVIIPLLSRSFLLCAMSAFSLTVSSQLGRNVKIGFSELPLPLGLGLVLAFLIAWYLDTVIILTLLLILNFGFVVLLAFYIHRRMAGLSGDAYGAIIEASEAFMLLLLSLL